MSNSYNSRAYQNYHFRHQRDIPKKIIGTTFDPYQPKISSQVTQEKYIQSLGSTLQRGLTPQKPYENTSSYTKAKRSSSTAPLINNSYNIINNNPYTRSPNYNTYGYTYNRDHVKDLLNLTGKETLTNFKANNTTNNKYKQNNYINNNYNNNNPVLNNIRTVNNYEISKNGYQEYNNNKNILPQEKESNDLSESYYENNLNYSIIKNYAYKENANSRYRDYMEDKGKSIINFNSNYDNVLFCLFDGHGGQEVSKYLQFNFNKFWKEIMPLNIDNYENKIKNIFLEIDKNLKENNYYQVGSTACIIYITLENSKRIIYCANVGDTRAVLIKTIGQKRLSYDDRANDPKEHDRIIKEGGVVFGGRVYGQLMLSRAFGDWELKTYGVSCIPHIIRYEIQDDDKYLIIASDGVWDVIDDEDVYQLSKNKNNSKDFCDEIMKYTIERGSMDNISCFVIGLN